MTAVSPNQQRIPTLDGWRGIAILLVIVSHAGIALRKTVHIPHPESIGQHGVAIFFVLSGFLITSRLQHEKETGGSIDLRSFYIRRFFRLMPCAWTYLVVMFLLTASSHPRPFTMQEVWATLLFFRNSVDAAGIHPITGHFWSLSIEEQFYLVWPSFLILGGTKWARWLATAGAGGIALYRMLQLNSLSHLPLTATFGTQYRADALLVGCAAALLLPVLRPYLRGWMSFPLFAALIWCVTINRHLIPLYESITVALLLMLTTERTNASIGRVLEARPLALVGTLSYSLYIWQQLFFLGMHTWQSVFIDVLLLPIVAGSSYRFIEEPFIRMGKKLARKLRTSGSVPRTAHESVVLLS